jgi:hypothetical protein
VYATLLFPIRATCPALRIHLDSITQIIFAEQHNHKRLIHTYHTVPMPAHAVPLPCSAAKGLDSVFPIQFTQVGCV